MSCLDDIIILWVNICIHIRKGVASMRHNEAIASSCFCVRLYMLHVLKKRSLAYYNVDSGIANVNMYVLIFVLYCISI